MIATEKARNQKLLYAVPSYGTLLNQAQDRKLKPATHAIRSADRIDGFWSHLESGVISNLP